MSPGAGVRTIAGAIRDLTTGPTPPTPNSSFDDHRLTATEERLHRIGELWRRQA